MGRVVYKAQLRAGRGILTSTERESKDLPFCKSVLKISSPTQLPELWQTALYPEDLSLGKLMRQKKRSKATYEG